MPSAHDNSLSCNSTQAGETTTVLGDFIYGEHDYARSLAENPMLIANTGSLSLGREFQHQFPDKHPSTDRQAFFDWIRQDPNRLARIVASGRAYVEAIKAHMVSVELEVRNARALEGAGLDTTGFTLHEHHSRVKDWSDGEHVRQVYYPEIMRHVQHLTGASHVFCNHHGIRRTADAGKPGTTQADPLNLVPAGGVHNDFSPMFREELAQALELVWSNEDSKLASGMGMVGAPVSTLQQLKEAGITPADLRSETKYRVMVVNAWRNCSPHPLETMPLAVCDRRTVADSDLVPHKVVPFIGDGVHTAIGSSTAYSAGHEWYYYPGMQQDEVLLFKTYDSEAPDKHRCGQLHGAFQPKGTKPTRGRYSCEARILCLVPLARTAASTRL